MGQNGSDSTTAHQYEKNQSKTASNLVITVSKETKNEPMQPIIEEMLHNEINFESNLTLRSEISNVTQMTQTNSNTRLDRKKSKETEIQMSDLVTSHEDVQEYVE